LYILQESLFSFEELQKLESKERLPIFFSALDLRPYAKELRSRSPRGADGHCKQGILRALLAAPLENISNVHWPATSAGYGSSFSLSMRTSA
jgi:IS5 family transposase